MSLPVYVSYELLIRLQEINKQTGEFVSSKMHCTGATLKTTTGTLEIPEELLYKQFNNPSIISTVEIAALTRKFKPTFLRSTKTSAVTV